MALGRLQDLEAQAGGVEGVVVRDLRPPEREQHAPVGQVQADRPLGRALVGAVSDPEPAAELLLPVEEVVVGALVEVRLGAELVQHYKPDPETYLSPAKFFDVPPSKVMMVAAHTPDLAVPKRLGLRTAYVHRPYEGGTSSGLTRPAAGSYDYIVNDLKELATALGC